MYNPIFYILCGLPFSGKTVLTKIITEKLHIPYVSIDEIKFSHGFNWSEDENMTEEEWQKIFNEAYKEIFSLLKEGKSVIYDSANHDRASRDDLRALAKKGNFQTKIIWIDTSKELVKKRWKENQKKQNRFHLPERFFQAALDANEPPAEDENAIRYTSEMNTDEWIIKNFPQ